MEDQTNQPEEQEDEPTVESYADDNFDIDNFMPSEQDFSDAFAF